MLLNSPLAKKNYDKKLTLIREFDDNHSSLESEDSLSFEKGIHSYAKNANSNNVIIQAPSSFTKFKSYQVPYPKEIGAEKPLLRISP
jgi:hypothetical protein